MNQYTLEQLNLEIDQYIQNHQEDARNFQFDINRLSPKFRSLIGLILPEENINKWLKDTRAFQGLSPLDKLSVLETNQYTQNVSEIVNAFYKMLSFAFVPEVPTLEDIIYETRLSQFEQLFQEGLQ
jgi:hypothetical protein